MRRQTPPPAALFLSIITIAAPSVNHEHHSPESPAEHTTRTDGAQPVPDIRLNLQKITALHAQTEQSRSVPVPLNIRRSGKSAAPRLNGTAQRLAEIFPSSGNGHLQQSPASQTDIWPRNDKIEQKKHIARQDIPHFKMITCIMIHEFITSRFRGVRIPVACPHEGMREE